MLKRILIWVIRHIIYYIVYYFPKILYNRKTHCEILDIIGWDRTGPTFYHVHAPKEFLNEEICKICVGYPYDYMYCAIEYYCLLKYVPEELRTEEVCKIALLCGNSYTFQYVPTKYRTRELMEYVITNGTSILGSMSCIRDDLTQELCDFAFDHDAIRFLNPNAIPRKYRTKRMCKIALERKYFEIQTKYTYDDIHIIFPKKVWREVLEDDWRYIRYIPNKLRTVKNMISCVQSILRLPR